MSERKPSKVDNVKWALYRTVTDVRPEKPAKAKWVVYTAVGISTLLLFGCEGPNHPKVPPNLGD